MSRKIAASIVCYKAATSVRALISALEAQTRALDSILIIDNSPAGSGLEQEELPARCSLVSFPENPGMADALATSTAWAKEHMCDDLWLFDQDSRPNPAALATLLEARAQLERDGLQVAVVACEMIETGTAQRLNGFNWTGKQFEKVQPQATSTPFACDAVLHSGSLVQLAQVDEADLPNSKMFIDAVDFEFCHRLTLRGFGIYVVPGAILQHTLGEKTTVRVPWKSGFKTYFHLSPLRIYCICRNYTWLEFKYSKCSAWPSILVARIKHCLYFSMGSLFGSKTPWRGICAAFLGTLLGILGPTFWRRQPHFKRN